MKPEHFINHIVLQCANAGTAKTIQACTKASIELFCKKRTIIKTQRCDGDMLACHWNVIAKTKEKTFE